MFNSKLIWQEGSSWRWLGRLPGRAEVWVIKDEEWFGHSCAFSFSSTTFCPCGLLIWEFEVSESCKCIFSICISPGLSFMPVRNQGFMHVYWIKRYLTFTCFDLPFLGRWHSVLQPGGDFITRQSCPCSLLPSTSFSRATLTLVSCFALYQVCEIRCVTTLLCLSFLFY